MRVEYSAHAPPYSSGMTGAWLVMTCCSLVIAFFWAVASPELSYCCSAAWASELEKRPKSPVAGLPTGALSLLSSQPL